MNFVIRNFSKLAIGGYSRLISPRQTQVIKLIQTDVKANEFDQEKSKGTTCENSSTKKRASPYQFNEAQICLMYGWVLKFEELYGSFKTNRRWSIQYSDEILNLVKAKEQSKLGKVALTIGKVKRAIEKLRMHIDRESESGYLERCRSKIDLEKLSLPFQVLNPQFVHKCTHCTKTYSTAKVLKQHIKDVHSGKRFTCPICSNIYHQKTSVLRHIKRDHR